MGRCRDHVRDAVERHLPDIRRGAEWAWRMYHLARLSLPTSEDAYHVGVAWCLMYAFPPSYDPATSSVPVGLHLYCAARQGVWRAARRHKYYFDRGEKLPDQASPLEEWDCPVDHDHVTRTLDRAEAWFLVEGLSPRERDCVVLSYGLDGGGERTNREVGDLLGVTRQAVQANLVRARSRMRQGRGRGCD